jgi:hypothetical protein
MANKAAKISRFTILFLFMKNIYKILIASDKCFLSIYTTKTAVAA